MKIGFDKYLEKLNKDPRKNSIISWKEFRKILNKNGYHITVTLPSTPFSFQSNSLKKYREAIFREVRNRNWNNVKDKCHGKEIKLSITYFLGEKYRISDLDNLLKLTLDCLKNNLFEDDSSIKEIHVSKEFLPKQKYRKLKEQTIIKLGFTKNEKLAKI